MDVCKLKKGLPRGLSGKESAYNAGASGDVGLIPGLGRSLGERHGNPLQYSCLENSHGQRSLVGYSPRGLKELDMTEQLSTAPCSIHHDFFFFLHACNYYTAEQFLGLYLVSPIALLGLDRKYSGC